MNSETFGDVITNALSSPEKVTLKRNLVCFAFLEVLSASRNDKETYAYFRGMREGITFALTGQLSKMNQETLITCASQIDLDKAVEQFDKELAAGKSFVE